MFASDQPYGEFHVVTPRVALRRFTADDRPVFTRLYTDADVMRHIGDGVPFTPKQVAERWERLRAHYRRHGYGMWAAVDRQTNKVIGRAGLQHTSEVDEVEVGYALLPEYWGKGLATEIAGALVAYGFQKLNFPQIVAMVRPQNTTSIRVLEKIGMRPDRTLEVCHAPALLFAAERVAWEHVYTPVAGARQS